jgi:hypothetical protein
MSLMESINLIVSSGLAILQAYRFTKPGGNGSNGKCLWKYRRVRILIGTLGPIWFLR